MDAKIKQNKLALKNSLNSVLFGVVYSYNKDYITAINNTIASSKQNFKYKTLTQTFLSNIVHVNFLIDQKY
jgi:hypothetical protein